MGSTHAVGGIGLANFLSDVGHEVAHLTAALVAVP